MYLDHVTDSFPGSQNIVHTVMTLGTAVTDIRMAVSKYILQKDLRLCNIFFIPAGTHLQSVKLCPQKPLGRAFLSVFHFPILTFINDWGSRLNQNREYLMRLLLKIYLYFIMKVYAPLYSFCSITAKNGTWKCLLFLPAVHVPFSSLLFHISAFHRRYRSF